MDDDFTPFKQWFKGSFARERRKAERAEATGVVAHYWDGSSTPVAHSVRDISSGGLYLLTERRWYPGTLIMLTLQRKAGFDDEDGRSITVQSKVLRAGPDGVALSFVTSNGSSVQSDLSSTGTNGKKSIRRFLDGMRESRGQSLIEFVLILPVVFLLIVNVVNFAAFFYAWITVSNAARAGADYAILGGVSAGSPSTPTGALVNNIITTDVLSLPNRASLVVNVCQNINGTTTALYGSCTSPGSDPEPASFQAITVDVTYTYQPLIPVSFAFAGLNVHATIPSTTIHRKAIMRAMP